MGKVLPRPTLTLCVCVTLLSAVTSGQDIITAKGKDDLPAAGPDDVPAAGPDNVPVAGQHDVPGVGQHDVPAAGQHDVTAAGQHDVTAAGPQDVPAAGQQDVPAAGQQDVSATGQHDVPAAGQDDVTAAGQQDIPTAGQQDVPAAGQDNVTAAGQSDVPAPGQDDVAAAEVSKLDITTVANKAVDFMLQLFKTTKSIVDRLTPLVINAEIPFPKGKVYDFQLYNLPDLERRGDINMSLHLRSGNATLGGGLGLTEMLVGSKYSYNPFLGLTMSGDVDVEIDDVVARMTFTVNMYKVRGHFELFKFQEFGQVRVTRFTGATPLFNWLGVLIMNKIIQTGSDLIRQKMDEKVKEYLTEVLEFTKLPITVS
uniref:Putative conserved secreted protein n=1 Tax=Ixodes ricinus TaxID=34613 RepID=A0A6B0VB38_IXORI